MTLDLQLITQAVLVLLIGSVGKMFLTRLDQIDAKLGLIDTHLAQLNGRTGRMEEWEIAHDKLDDERFTGLTESIRELRSGRAR